MSSRGITATEYVAMENMRERHEGWQMRSFKWLFQALFPAWAASLRAPPWYINPFIYKPLADPTSMIRLIELHEAKPYPWYDPEQTIVIDTKEISLSECPQDQKFVAISYCWGDPNDTVKIICNGNVMTITKSLHDALLRFRGEGKRVFWADAICINQADDEEKSHQVRLMRQIYEKAHIVAVWLGEEASYSDHVLNLSEAFGEALRRTYMSDNRSYKDPSVQKSLFKHLPQLNDVGWSSVGQFLQRPWFGRMWVIQEIAVAPDAMLHCGSSSTSWSTFAELLQFMLAVGLLESHPDNHAEKVAALMKTRENFQKKVQEDFLVMMLRHRPCQATVGKDKIFALHGISKFPLHPDYTRTDEDIFTDAAIEMMKLDSNLDILSVPHAVKQAAQKALPSWVPDWTDTPFVAASIPRAKITEGVPEDPGFQAAGDIKNHEFSVEVSEDRKVLTVQGYVMDEIVQVAKPVESLSWGQSISDIIYSDCCFYGALVTWEGAARARSKTPYVTGENMLDAYWQTLLAGRTPRELDYHRAVFQEWEQSWSVWWYVFQLPLPIGFLIWSCWAFGMVAAFIMYAKHQMFGWKDSVPKRSKKEIQVFKYSILNRRLIRTTRGYIGLAASGAQKGDRIALVRCGRVPLVLRQNSKSDTSDWHFVGDTYIHGIMYGAAFDTSRCENMNLS